MKKLLLSLACAFSLVATYAQKPEPVYGPARIERPMSWYKEQSSAWKKEIDKDPKNARAWYNYYYANRVLNYNDSEDKRSNEQRQADMNKLLDEMGKNIPDTYEYNLCKWAAGGFDTKLLPYLKKAAELGPDRTEHLDFMINIAEMDRNVNDREKYSLRKFETGNYSTGMLYYNYNVLMGLAPNAILITCGDNDTYPIWALQAQGIRKDITVINVSLAHIDDYRDKLFGELGVEKMQVPQDNGSKDSKKIPFHNILLNHLVTNKKNYPVYLALTTVNEAWNDTVQENLYLTGLAYQYSKHPVDNMARLKRNFEQNFALDYIDRPFYSDISADKVKTINTNYLVPMLKLYDHYAASGDLQKQEWIRNKILSVSKDTEAEADVKKHVNK